MTASPAPRPALAAQDLRAGYGPVEVIRGVTFDVRPGEMVALLGPNGAGKTTLLQTLCGFVRPSAGEVLFGGEPSHVPPHRRAHRGLGYLGEDRHIFPGLTVAQNLKLVPNGVAGAVARFPELAALLRRRAGWLSGGEQQMLALGRALAAAPRVLLIDELSLGLAPLVRQRLLGMLRAAADHDHAAVLVVEQSAKAVLEVADRAMVLRRGEIVDEAPAQRWCHDLDHLADLYLR
jgi:branched-chain amino acid transport system ATP-binding protein